MRPPPVVTLITPIPPAGDGLLWQWLREDPAANFDDGGPRTFEAFQAMMARRRQHERTWWVIVDGVPQGAIGVQILSRRLAKFNGVCFTRAACGTGVARTAVIQVLAALWSDGVEKIEIQCFATNRRVRRFFEKLGAECEGTLARHTTQHGALLDVTLMALFRPATWPKGA
jgi:RimJ/RimL family protein N-acetyltransferase